MTDTNTPTDAGSCAAAGSAFLRDVVDARRMWGERDSWKRDATGECKADRVWMGLAWSAAHEGMLLGKGPGGEWTEQKQNALEAARLEYEMRSRMTLSMPNAPGERPGQEARELKP